MSVCVCMSMCAHARINVKINSMPKLNNSVICKDVDPPNWLKSWISEFPIPLESSIIAVVKKKS